MTDLFYGDFVDEYDFQVFCNAKCPHRSGKVCGITIVGNICPVKSFRYYLMNRTKDDIISRPRPI